MRTLLTSITIIVLLASCDEDDTLRSVDQAEMRSPGAHLGYAADPAAQIFCCKNPGGCVEPNKDGSCPNDTFATCCADELTCNGEACWYECGPEYCPANS